MNSFNPRRILTGAILTAAVLTVSAEAAVGPSIGVNFAGGSFGGAPTDMFPDDVAGVSGFAQANYNNVGGQTGGPISLFDSDGLATAVTLTFSGAGTWGTNIPTDTPNGRLMNGYVDGTDNGTNTYTFDNVPDGNYTLLIYSMPDGFDGRDESLSITTGVVNVGPTTYFLSAEAGAEYTINGFVRATATELDGPGAIGNYIQFDDISPSGGTVSITGTSLNFRNFSNGIQLVPTPEPSAAIALVSGAGMLLGLRRRPRTRA